MKNTNDNDEDNVRMDNKDDRADLYKKMHDMAVKLLEREPKKQD